MIVILIEPFIIRELAFFDHDQDQDHDYGDVNAPIYCPDQPFQTCEACGLSLAPFGFKHPRVFPSYGFGNGEPDQEDKGR